MKYSVALLASAIALLPIARAADSFEGTVTMKMTPPTGAPSNMTFSVKAGFARVDIDAGRGMMSGVIMDDAKKEMTILIPQNQMYMVQPIPQPAATAQDKNAPAGTLEKTSVTEKILGYDTTKYIAKSADGKSSTEMWLTDQLGMFPGMGNGGAGMMGGRRGAPATPAGQEWAAALSGKSAFPLRVVTKDAASKETFRMEATAIDKKTLAASVFAVPAGWQDVGAMMRGALQGIPQGMMPGGIPGMPGAAGRGN